MKSRTSFFNLTLFKKNITRFAPLWVLYTVGMILLLFSMFDLNYYFNNEFAKTLSSIIGPLSAVNLVYGILAAQLLFGELFNARQCNALHAMPVTREARFGSHFLSGLAFSVVPNLLIGLLMVPFLPRVWYLGLLWWLAMTLQYLFFFGTAVFSVQCTGNRFAAVLVYSIINYGSMAALWFVDAIFIPLLRGVVLTTDGFMELSPVVRMCITGDYFLLEKNSNGSHLYLAGLDQSWIYLAICGAVGVVLMAGALLIYRRRALESAGDFMAVKWLKPVFLVLYTLCAGALLAVVGSFFGNQTYLVFLAAGILVGFFTGKMLLERTARVFKLKSFLQLGILALVMWLSLQAVQFDVFGIERYVPEVNQVEKAEVITYSQGKKELKLYTEADLMVLQKAHALALEEEGCKHGMHQEYEITYHLKNGGTVKRQYTLCTQEEAVQEFKKLFNSVNGILGITSTWEEYVKSVTGIRVEGLTRQNFLNEEDWESFLDCVYEDCCKGRAFGSEFAVSDYGITIWRGEESVHLWAWDETATNQWLREYEKKDMESYLQTVTEITLSEIKIGQEHYRGLLEAIYADCKEYTLHWNDEYENKNARYVVRIKTGFYAPVKVICVPEYAENTYEWIKEYILERWS